MRKISIKREQSQAGLSFAERENRRSAAGGKAKFRPQVKNKLFLLLVLLLTAATGARAQISGNSIDISSGESGTLSSDMTCTYLIVVYNSTLTVNQGVTLTLNCEEDFNLKYNSAINLHGTMTGSVGDDADWNSNSYINVYLSDGAKYTVSGLECMDGYGYLRYYGYDAATDGHGTVSVTNGSTAVTASSIGYSSTTYTFTATPASGYHFVNWTKGAGREELGTDASIDVTCEQNGQYQVYANFEEDATAATTYTVTMKDGVKDADKWTVKVGEGEAQALPIGGLKGDGSETVTLQYNGRLKVKGVKATSDEKPAAPAWDLTAKLAYTGGEIADFTDATDDLTTMTWAKGEHIAILYEVSGTKKVADAEITAVDGTTGAATITFKVEAGTPDNTACTLVYPYDAAKDDHTGVKDAATLLANQDGTLNANLDVRVGAGTIQTTTPGLTVTTQPEAQFAIFKFTTKSVPSANGSLQNTNVTKLTVTIGAQDYVNTSASATSTLYAALPAVDGQTVSFTATDGSNLYAASKASVSFDAAKYYQSTVKMGKVIEVFEDDDPILEDFTRNPSYKYLHIGLEQAYAIARQLSTQNTGATVAVVYNNDNRNVTYALSSDASATERTLRGDNLFENNYRVFLATLWEDAD